MSEEDILKCASNSTELSIYEIFSENSSVEEIHDFLFTFAQAIEAKVAAKEREACVKRYEAEADTWNAWPYAGAAKRKGAEAIRAKSE